MKPTTQIGPDGHVTRRKGGHPRCPCGKQAYSSRKVAKSIAAVQAKTTGEPLHAYRCDRGGHCWHIGHPPGTARARADQPAPVVHLCPGCEQPMVVAGDRSACWNGCRTATVA